MALAAILGCVAFWHAVGFEWWGSVLVTAGVIFGVEFLGALLRS